ncbi:hypothetical protein Bca4012_096068 [Brassica carinata]
MMKMVAKAFFSRELVVARTSTPPRKPDSVLLTSYRTNGVVWMLVLPLFIPLFSRLPLFCIFKDSKGRENTKTLKNLKA